MKKFLIIGNGSQSKRIQKILKKLKKNFLIFDYKNKKKEYLNSVFSSDVIFICSPNKTHFKYIMYFIKKRKFIFCEKPPVNKVSELKILSRTSYKKIYFNYNYRHSLLGKILYQKKKFRLGNLLSGNIYSTHGLASKSIYRSSWRSNKLHCPKGIFEIVTIHMIDLLNYYLDIKKINKINLKNISKVGNSFDTVNVKLTMKNNAEINIFNSYYAPYFVKWNLVFENGIIELDDKNIKIRGPRNSFDKDKNFILPKIIKKFTISHSKDYQKSLINSINFFLSRVKKNKSFGKQGFLKSLSSNKLVLKKN